MIPLGDNLIVCIDDTDVLHGMGTGKLAHLLTEFIESCRLGGCGFITRHQLYVHPDIPYTSHNSAMCFNVRLDCFTTEQLLDQVSFFLAIGAADGSDPGLCILDPARARHLDRLVEFGRRAKGEVLTKDDAYGLAEHTGAYLSEHGGTGDGVIGALAGVGLRLSGNDGRLRGRLEMGEPGDVLSVGAILAGGHIDNVMPIGGTGLAVDERVCLGEKVKGIYLDGKPVLPVARRDDGLWRTCTKEELKCF